MHGSTTSSTYPRHPRASSALYEEQELAKTQKRICRNLRSLCAKATKSRTITPKQCDSTMNAPSAPALVVPWKPHLHLSRRPACRTFEIVAGTPGCRHEWAPTGPLRGISQQPVTGICAGGGRSRHAPMVAEEDLSCRPLSWPP